MHFEFLIEDLSGKTLLDILVPQIIRKTDTFRCIKYKGIGHIPPNMTTSQDPTKRQLLTQLPQLLRGYGNDPFYRKNATIVVVCDLDNRCLNTFQGELLAVLNNCKQAPRTLFCIAVEEGEAWLLGDIPAIKAAYPTAKDNILSSYINDSICGTWEHLADALLPKGHRELKKKGFQAIGTQKSVWAEKIGPHMDIARNRSPSFRDFRDKLSNPSPPSLDRSNTQSLLYDT